MPPLVTICARKNSGRLPGKNTKLMHGKPLFRWTFDIATNLLCHVVVSSDDEQILTSSKFDYHFTTIKRPEHLDDVGKMAQIRDAVTIMEHRMSMQYDPIIDLDVTNPMRTVPDIQEMIDRSMFDDNACIVSVVPARRRPDFNQIPLREKSEEDCWDMNASIYVYRRKFLMQNDHPVGPSTEIYVMPEWTFCDIDTELDFKLVEFLMKEYGYVEKTQDQA